MMQTTPFKVILTSLYCLNTQKLYQDPPPFYPDTSSCKFLPALEAGLRHNDHKWENHFHAIFAFRCN